MAVEIATEAGFTAGNPRVLLEEGYHMQTYGLWPPNYDVSADSQRFLMVQAGEDVPTQLRVILNWTEELKRLVPNDN